MGDEIIRHSLNCARELSHGAVIIVEHPNCCPRFGPEVASDYGLTMPDGGVMESFMAMELVGGCLGAAAGTWREDEVYEIDDALVKEWDAKDVRE